MENNQTYQPQMTNSGGGGSKLPNANCDQTTKWKKFEIESGRPFFLRPGGKHFLVLHSTMDSPSYTNFTFIYTVTFQKKSILCH